MSTSTFCARTTLARHSQIADEQQVCAGRDGLDQGVGEHHVEPAGLIPGGEGLRSPICPLARQKRRTGRVKRPSFFYAPKMYCAVYGRYRCKAAAVGVGLGVGVGGSSAVTLAMGAHRR